MKKQDMVAEQIEKLSHMVQDIKDRFERRKEKKGETKLLRDEIKDTLYQALMATPAPKYTRHAHAEGARKKIMFTLLYYTGAQINELREITHTDLINVLEEGQLKLVLRKQRDAIEKVLPLCGHEAIEEAYPRDRPVL